MGIGDIIKGSLGTVGGAIGTAFGGPIGGTIGGALGGGLGSMFGANSGSGTSTNPNRVPMTPAEIKRNQLLQDEYFKMLGYQSNVSSDPAALYERFHKEFLHSEQTIATWKQQMQSTERQLNEVGRQIQQEKDPERKARLQSEHKQLKESRYNLGQQINRRSAENQKYQQAVKAYEAGDETGVLSLADSVRDYSQPSGYMSPEDQIAADYKRQADPILQQFNELLTQTLSKDFQLNGANPAEANVAAQKFVDETYYNQARASFEDFAAKTKSDLSARAASLGRDPNLDSATNSQFFDTAGRALRDIDLQRGSQVAQRQDLLAYQRPVEALARATGGLETIRQNSGYLSDLATRAQQNRISLLNGVSGLNQSSFQERYPGFGGGQTSTQNYSPAQNFAGGIAGGAQLGKGIADLFNTKSAAPTAMPQAGGGQLTLGGQGSGVTLGGQPGGKFGFQY